MSRRSLWTLGAGALAFAGVLLVLWPVERHVLMHSLPIAAVTALTAAAVAWHFARQI